MSTLFGKAHKRAKRKLLATSQNNEEKSSDQKIEHHEGSIENIDGQYKPTQVSPWTTFAELGLAEPLVDTCRALGFKRPTPVQRTIIPFLLRPQSENLLVASCSVAPFASASLLQLKNGALVGCLP